MKKTFIAIILLVVMLFSNVVTAYIAYNRGTYYGERKVVCESFEHISDLDVGEVERITLNGEEISINERVSFFIRRTH